MLDIRSMALTAVLASLVACGGGGSSSNNEVTPVGDTDNGDSETQLDSGAVDVSTAAVTLSKQIVASNGTDVPFALPALGSSSGGVSKLQGPIAVIVEESDTVTESGACGGSVTSDVTVSFDDELTFPLVIDLLASFDDFCDFVEPSGTITINGTIAVDVDFVNELEGTSAWITDLTYTSDAPGIPVSGSYSEEVFCTFTDGIDFAITDANCTSSVLFDGGELGRYRSADSQVSGDNDSGYDVSFSFTDEQGNQFDASFTGITICENGNIGTGSGSISYNGDVIDVEFISCDEVVVTYQGVSETRPQ